MFDSLESIFPEIALRETRTLLVSDPPGKGTEDSLPSAGYEFHEFFCTDLECDCERVIFVVRSAQYLDGEALAVIDMDLAPVSLFRRLLGGGKPRLLPDGAKAGVEVEPVNLRFALELLWTFSAALAADSKYLDRVRRHQKLFREALVAREEKVYPLLDARPPLTAKEVRALSNLYRETRALSRHHNDGPVLEFQEPDLVIRSAARLGMLSGESTIVLETEDDIGFLMEFAHYGLRSSEGDTLAQRYNRAHAAEADEPTRRLLSAMNDARFGLLRIESVIPGLGAMVTDTWRKERGLVADLTLGDIGQEGMFVIGHYLRFPEFWIGTGGLAGISRTAVQSANSALKNKLEAASASSVEELSPHDLEDLAAVIMRYNLTGKMPPARRPEGPKRLARTTKTDKKPPTPKRRRHR